MKKIISEKDKKDWENFIKDESKIEDKDDNSQINKDRFINITIDLHGYSLDDANNRIRELIIDSYKKKVSRIKIITGKGKRSKNKENPYFSKELSILKNSVPNYIFSNLELMKYIKKINRNESNKLDDGFFEILLKKNIIR